MQMISLSTIHLNDGSFGLPKNPRFIRDDRFRALCRSIADNPEYMPARPIIVNEAGVILGGNMRYRACLENGLVEVPASWVQRVEGWPLEKQKRFVILDNRGFGEDDMDALANEWEIEDLIAAGFEEADLTGYDAQEHQDGDADAEPQVDRADELNEKWNVKTGDLWLIGGHRLLCGDSTKAEDVARLLGDRKPVLMVTDPPYGVEYDPGWRAKAGVNKNTGKMGKVANDDVADWSPAWRLFPGDAVYVYHAGVMSSTVQSSLEICGFKIRAQIIWAKDRMALSRGDYHWQHEPCWYAVREGKPGHRTDDRTQTTLWEIPAREDSGHGHGTQKPIECMARPMRNHDAPEVYDPFLGSGTTMVAAQNLGRTCYGLEIAPNYCAVILQRMADAFHGIEIKREEGGAA